MARGRGLCRTRAPVVSMSRPTGARARPVEVVDSVSVFSPASPGGYFRLRWTGLDGRRSDTSGGRDLDTARAKAAQIRAGLARAAGPSRTRPAPHGRPWLPGPPQRSG